MHKILQIQLWKHKVILYDTKIVTDLSLLVLLRFIIERLNPSLSSMMFHSLELVLFIRKVSQSRRVATVYDAIQPLTLNDSNLMFETFSPI